MKRRSYINGRSIQKPYISEVLAISVFLQTRLKTTMRYIKFEPQSLLYIILGTVYIMKRKVKILYTKSKQIQNFENYRIHV